jgi:hypothetical protein
MRVKALVFIAAALSLVSGLAAPTPAVAAGGGSSAPAAAANHAENQDGVSRSLSSTYKKCQAVSYGANVCFQPYGDLLWVNDTQADGNSAYIYWENWQADSTGIVYLVRYGRCYNRLGSANGWAVCDKDFVETTTSPNDVGGEGSWIDFAPCVVNEGCGTTVEQENNS